jgi:hypothetical protein
MQPMKEKLHILFIVFSLNLQGISAEGLRFFGNGYPIEERTSYNVFEEYPVTFSEHCEIKFDLYLYLASGIGNIVRIKTKNEKRVFNLYYDGYGDYHLFLLNEEGKSNLIRVELDKSTYPPLQWFTVAINFDLAGGTITLTVADKTTKVENIALPDKLAPIIVFGKSDYIIDVPTFAIRDLSVGNDKAFKFRLDEYHGNIVYDLKGRETGNVINPYWLINDSYQWKSEAQFNSSTVSGTNYHEGRHELYYFNRDSILIFNSRTKSSKTVIFSEPCPVDLLLGTNFIDSENNRLYSYEVYHNSGYQGPSVASLDLYSFEWRIESYDELPTQLHHHGSWFDPSSRQYMIFGGFGNRHFCNQFHQYDLDRQEWSIFPVENKGGITPRYFTSLGHRKQNHQLYLFGGTGNVSGNQLLGREYFYDLYRLDLQTNVLTKVWETPWHQENAVPVRGMVINNESFFYTLCYPEKFTESYLKLQRFSFEN